MLHLTGYNVTMKDLQSFRKLDSITPGHPETGITDGIEVTTGPLGQGIANAVGLAIGEAHLAAKYNKPGFELFDNFTYVFCGDGCLQEGVAAEAASLAGHLGLGKIIVFYDDNNITIDGDTTLSFTEDVLKRHDALGWHTSTVVEGNTDIDAIARAVEAAKLVTDKPSMIAIKTVIGYGSVNEGTHGVHGSPLKPDDIKQLKSKFGFDPNASFQVPAEVYNFYKGMEARGAGLESAWNQMFAAYSKRYPALGSELERRLAGKLPTNWQAALPTYSPKDKANATRNTSGQCLNALAKIMPELMGGSADLTPSNKTALKGETDFQADNPIGRYLRFGIREHAMVAIGNGMHAYGGLIPFTATFMNFIEYAFPAVRLAALSHHKQLLIMTHDSIGLGEDGPTHQPIEAMALCRATPNVADFRPCGGTEVAGSYIAAVEHNGPSVLSLSRQNLTNLPGASVEGTLKGAYVIQDCRGKPDLILVSTGSEVEIAVAASGLLAGLKVRVVSMPSMYLFEKQSPEYQNSVLIPGIPTVAIEALATFGWDKYAHYTIGMTTFGASAPYKHLYKKFGFTPENIALTAKKVVKAFKKSGCVGPLGVHIKSAL